MSRLIRLHAVAKQPVMGWHRFRYVIGSGIWATVLYVTLSLTGVSGNWGHDVCGPWGCGPPVQVLLAWHLSWCVVLFPTVWLMRSKTAPRHHLKIAAGVVAIAVVGMSGVTVYQRLTWLPAATASQQACFWHRAGFMIITLVELPLLELLPAALWLALPVRRTADSAADS